MIHVLLIEDNPGDASLLRQQLREAGPDEFRVEWTDHLGAGLELAAKDGFDVVLLDLSLPESRGLETLSRFRAQAPALPVLILSGLEDEDTALEAVRRGAQEYLVKGRVSGPSVVRCIRYALQRHRAVQEQIRSGARPHCGRVFAFAGAKGGVGTTTVVLNLAARLGLDKANVIAVELADYAGGFAAQLRHAPRRQPRCGSGQGGQEPPASDLAARLVSFPFPIRALFGPQTPEQFTAPLEAEQALEIVWAATQLADYVLVDLPSRPSPVMQAVAGRAEMLALVTDREPCSSAAGKAVYELLKSWGLRPALAALIVNTRTSLMPSLSPAEIAAEIGCRLIGVIPSATDMLVQCHKKGQPLVVLNPDCVAAQAFAEITRQLTNVTIEALAV